MNLTDFGNSPIMTGLLFGVLSHADEIAVSARRNKEPDRAISDILARVGSALPPMAALAALFACVDLVVVRILLRSVDDETLWNTIGDYTKVPISVAAISSCIALTASLVSILRMPPPPRFMQRLNLAMFTGVFVPVVAAATFMPRTVIVRDTNFLVHLASFSAVFLVGIFSSIAVGKAGPVSFRVASLLTAFTSLASGFFLLATSIGAFGSLELVSQLAGLSEKVGLVCYCLVPVVIGAAAVARLVRTRRYAILAAGTAAGLVSLVALTLHLGTEPKVEQAITAGLGFHELTATWRLAPVIMISIFASTIAWLSLRGRYTAACAVALLLSAGFSPTAPGYLIMWVLGCALLMRASISASENGLSAHAANATHVVGSTQ